MATEAAEGVQPAPNTQVVFPRPVSKFMELLRAIGDGDIERDLSDKVVEMTSRLLELGEAGGKPSATFTFKVKVKYDRTVFIVEPTIDVKLPQPVRPLTAMYAARDGGLSVKNPAQQAQSEFRELVPPDRPLRDLNAVPR